MSDGSLLALNLAATPAVPNGWYWLHYAGLLLVTGTIVFVEPGMSVSISIRFKVAGSSIAGATFSVVSAAPTVVLKDATF